MRSHRNKKNRKKNDLQFYFMVLQPAGVTHRVLQCVRMCTATDTGVITIWNEAPQGVLEVVEVSGCQV